jgi:hypothetical protein
VMFLEKSGAIGSILGLPDASSLLAFLVSKTHHFPLLNSWLLLQFLPPFVMREPHGRRYAAILEHILHS